MPRSVASTESGSSYASSVSEATTNEQAKQDAAENEGGEDAAAAEDVDHGEGIMEGVFGTLFLLCQAPLAANRPGWKTGLLTLVAQAAQLVWLLLSPATQLWAIDTASPAYVYTRWVLFRLPVIEYKGYGTYLVLQYVLFVLLVVLIGLAAWLAAAVKKDEHLRRRYSTLIWAVRSLCWVLLVVFPVACLDFLGASFSCAWQAWPNPTLTWHAAAGSCVKMPHLVHAAMGAAAFVLYATAAVLMAVGTAEPNPVARGLLAGPNLDARLRLALLQVSLVICAGHLSAQDRWQAGLCLWLCLWTLWILLKKVPFYRPATNHLHCGLWLALAYISTLALAVTHMPQHMTPPLTMAVLYGIAPAFLAGAVMSTLRQRLIARDLAAIEAAPVGSRPRDVLRLQGMWHVELLSRCVRVWARKTGELEPEAVEQADNVLKLALGVYGPACSPLLALSAAFKSAVHRDNQQARMQLQAAARAGHGLLDAYAAYCIGQYIKCVKDGQGDGGLDLASYVELQRSYRAATRAHRTALQAQRAFWRLLLSERLHFDAVEEALAALAEAEGRAAQVYRRVMERYPGNAKLLRVYGRFVEEVQHDPGHAMRLYSEAERCGNERGANLSSLLRSLDSSDVTRLDIDDRQDGVLVINASGTIMTLNSVLAAMFGYAPRELQGRNVSILVPPPYSAHHDRYMSRYITTGDPHVIGSVRRVLGLHKSHAVLPLHLAVAHLSGSGSDSIFLGVFKHETQAVEFLEVWCLPHSGIVLSLDARFPDWFGFSAAHMAGTPVKRMAHDPDQLQAFLTRASLLPPSELAAGTTTTRITFAHKYLQPVDADVTAMPAGTACVPWIILRVRPCQAAPPNAVLDAKLSIVSASADFAQMLGYTARTLEGLSLTDILPPPWSLLHAGWVRAGMPSKPPPLSCRSGISVPLVTRTNTQVLVQATISTKTDADGTHHVVQVSRASPEALLARQRLVVTLERTSGSIVEVAPGSCADVFGWDPQLLLGRSLNDLVDVFGEWEGANGQGSSVMLLQVLAESAAANEGESWRVGVKHQQEAPGGSAKAAAAAASAAGTDASRSWSSIIEAKLKSSRDTARVVAARMQLLVDGVEDADSAGRLSIALWRSDLLSGVIEVDQDLRVIKADTPALLLLGAPTGSMAKQPLSRYISLARGAKAADLLQVGPRLAAAKGGMKRRGPTWALGTLEHYRARHRDGQPLSLQMQALGRDGPLSRRVLLHLHMQSADTGCLAAFTNAAMADGSGSDGEGGAESDRTAGTAVSSGGAGSRSWKQHGDGRMSSKAPGGGRKGGAAQSATGAAAAAAAAARPARHAAFRDGASEGLPGDDDISGHGGSGAAGKQGRRQPAGPRGAASRQQQQQQQAHPQRASSPPARALPGGGRGRGGGGGDVVVLVGGGSDNDDDDQEQQYGPGGEAGARLLRPDGRQGHYISSSTEGLRQRAGRGYGAGRQQQWQEEEQQQQRGWPRLASNVGTSPAAARTAGGSEAAGGSGGYGRRGGHAQGAVADDGDGDGNNSDSGGEHAAAYGAGAWPHASRARAAGATAGRHSGLAAADTDDRGGGGAGAGGLLRTSDDAASEGGGSEGADSASEGTADTGDTGGAGDEEHELHIDARRARRLRKLLALLSAPRATAPTRRFVVHTWGVLLLLLGVHVLCFVLFTLQVDKQHEYAFEVEEAARAADGASVMAVRTFVVAACAQPSSAQFLICNPNQVRAWRRSVYNTLLAQGHTHRGLYLGFHRLKHFGDDEVDRIWNLPLTREVVPYDVTPPRLVAGNNSVWVMGNRAIAAGWQYMYDVTSNMSDPRQSRHYTYIQQQATGGLYSQYMLTLDRLVARTFHKLDSVRAVLVVLLVMEAFGVVLALVLYQLALVHSAARHHMLLFTSFLGLPSATLRSMAARPCMVDEDDVVAEEEEELPQVLESGSRRQGSTGGAAAAGTGGDDAPGGGKQVRLAAAAHASDGKSRASKAARAGTDNKHGGLFVLLLGLLSRVSFLAGLAADWGPAARKAFKVNGRRLLPSRRTTAKCMVLFVAFQLVLIIIYALSFWRLSRLVGPISQLNTAQHIVFRASRTRVHAIMLVFGETPQQRAAARAALADACALLDEEYHVLLYGGIIEEVSRGVASAFRKYSPPLAFASWDNAATYFAMYGCLRADKSGCYPPGHKYHEASHRGIDYLMLRYLKECSLLTHAPDETLNPDNSHYEFMWCVGASDLYDGTRLMAGRITESSIAAYNQLRQLHVVLLVLCIILPLLYLAAVFRPLLITWRWQVARLAGLLSLLPAEVDVEARLKAALAHNAKPPPAQPLQSGGAPPAGLLHGAGLQALPPPHVTAAPLRLATQQRPSGSSDGDDDY